MDKLRVYKSSLELVVQIYKLIDYSKLKNDFSLNDQLKRSSISVLANIAEGYKRSKKQFSNYLQIASGSANETVALLQVVSAIYKINTQNLQDGYIILGRQINSFSKTILNSD